MEICNCGRSFESKRSLSSHARFCKDYVKTRKPKLKEYICECGKVLSNAQALNSHYRRCLVHRNNEPCYVNHNYPFANITADERKKIIDKVSMKLKGRSLSDDHKTKISESLKRCDHSNWGGYREGTNKWKGGRVFSTELNKEIWLDSSWEIKFVKILDSHDISWIRNYDKFDYVYLDKNRKYTPDFLIPCINVWVEVKGWEREVDHAKWYHFPYDLKIVRKHDLLGLENMSREEILSFLGATG